MGGGGVDGAIHRAGGPAIMSECRKVRKTQYPDGLPAGQAVATTGGALKAKHVIHTVGPIWHGGNHSEAETLASCYRESLRLAETLALGSVAFPSISTGAFGYPTEAAAHIAITTVREVLRDARSVRRVRLVLFGEHAYETHARVARDIARKHPCELEEE
jgi:O-acetyl-ADP-ribose deacetylase (regulator of RNase III)